MRPRNLNILMIKIENLAKSFGATRAVDGISFNVERGEVVGFLGPNGSGKSTTMRMITGYYPPTSGSAGLTTTSSGPCDIWITGTMSPTGSKLSL